MLRQSTPLHRCRLLPALGVGLLAILAVAIMGLTLSALAQNSPNLSVSKTASEIYVHPNEVLTYTITLTNTGTESALVTLTDTMPWGVDYVEGSATGGASYSGGQVTWSGTVDPDQVKVITFQVLVAEPGTEGPLPIFNQACTDDGTDMVCDSITIYSGRYKVFLPIIARNWAPPPAQGAQAIFCNAGQRGTVAYNAVPVPTASSLYPSTCDRFGVGVNLGYGDVNDYDVARLHAGWYVDWHVQQAPPHPAGLDYMQMVQTSGDTFSPDEATLAAIAAANPGSIWLIGNEPDSIYQGNSTPDQYARVYHQLYTFLKARDPTCRVTVGGVVQATSLRLQWLDAVTEAYQTRYGETLPVDLWNIHTFILREERGSWGADIPPGINVSQGELWEIEDHDRLDLLAGQIVRFRQWMKDRGERDKELIVSEYGILMPDYLGFDYSRVSAFMLNTFDYFTTAVDSELGYSPDGNRLVQRWAWYSLNDKRYEGYTSHSHLFDPDTQDITLLGVDFENYVTPLCTSYVDLVPAALTFSPTQPLVLNGQPVTITLTAMVRDAGNTDAANVPLHFWVGDADHPIGNVQTIATLPARSLASVSIEWQGVSSGSYTVGVTVDAEDIIAESDEANNQASRSLLVAGHVTFLPLVVK